MKRVFAFSVVALVALAAIAGASSGWSAWQAHRAAAERAQFDTGVPRAELDHKEYDFGLVDVGSKRDHVFRLTNVGDGILTVKKGPSSCKCTVLNLRNGELLPGESRDIRLSFEAEEENESFRHGAAFFTNDPEQPELTVVAVGKIRKHFSQSTSQIVVRDLKPGDVAKSHVLLFSGLDEMEILSAESSSSQLTWSESAPTAEDLAEWSGRSGKAIELSLDVGAFKQSFSGRIHFDVRAKAPDGTLRSMVLAVLVDAPRNKPMQIYGPRWDQSGVDLGTIEEGRGRKHQLYILLRPDHPAVQFGEVRCDREFVKLAVKQDERKVGARTQYILDIEIPPDAPPCNCMGGDSAKVTIATDHPDQPELSLWISFAIVP